MSAYMWGLLTPALVVAATTGLVLAARLVLRVVPSSVVRMLHRDSTDHQRNAVAAVVNVADRATFIGGERGGLIIVRGYHPETAKEALGVLERHGPHRTRATLAEAVPDASPTEETDHG